MGNRSISPPRTAYSPGLTTWADMAVARQRELRLELGFVQLLLRLEVEGVAGQERGRRQAVQRGGGGHQHHIGLALRDAPQRGQPLADQVLVRAEGVVGQRFPVREQRAAQAGRKEGHFVDEALRIGGVGGDDGRGALRGFVTLGQAGQQQGIGAAHGAGQGEAFTRGEFGSSMRRRGRQPRSTPWARSAHGLGGAGEWGFQNALLMTAALPALHPFLILFLCRPMAVSGGLVPCAGMGLRAVGCAAQRARRLHPRCPSSTTWSQASPWCCTPWPLFRVSAVCWARWWRWRRVTIFWMPMPDPGLFSRWSAAALPGLIPVLGGLKALLARGAQPQDWVLVHDAARCLITSAQIDTLIDACLRPMAWAVCWRTSWPTR